MRSPRGGAEGYRSLSLWWDTLPGPLEARPPLAGDLDVDVAVVGGGFTGLWTAYYLRRADPGRSVAVLERDVAGAGASGRNGGWCSALFAASPATLDRLAGPGAGAAMGAALRATVDEVGRVAAAEGIECGYAKGGTVVVARTPAQWARARAEVDEARVAGVGPEDLALLSADEAAARVGATGVLGGTFTPHCAALDPARLVRGLAEAVERAGVAVFEQTTVLAVEDGTVLTTGGTVRAGTVVRATEGYTPLLRGEGRTLAPLYSLMVATEPLPDAVWDRVGLAGRPTFADFRHLIVYGQRTADGRLAFGGRGAPYHLGSAVRPRFDRDARVHAALEAELAELFPALEGVAITHRWGGPLGVARDWVPSVGVDPTRRLAWAGGYVGDGVATANLAGRTLADLVCGRDSELTALPWVGHRWPRWEREPLRWAGVNAGLALAARADRAEARAGRSTWHGRALARLTGG